MRLVSIFSFASPSFNNDSWDEVRVHHDWAIELPVLDGHHPVIPRTMGQLPVHGVGWYRRAIFITDDSDGSDKHIYYLDSDGSMSYPMVWANGHLLAAGCTDTFLSDLILHRT